MPNAYRLVGGPRHGEVLAVESTPVIVLEAPPVAYFNSTTDRTSAVEIKRTTYSVQTFVLFDPSWVDPDLEGGSDQERPERRATRLLLWDPLYTGNPEEARSLAIEVLAGRKDPGGALSRFAWDALADPADPYAIRHLWDHQMRMYLPMERVRPTDTDWMGWPTWRDPRPIDARRIPDPQETAATRAAKDLAEGLANAQRRPYWPGPL